MYSGSLAFPQGGPLSLWAEVSFSLVESSVEGYFRAQDPCSLGHLSSLIYSIGSEGFHDYPLGREGMEMKITYGYMGVVDRIFKIFGSLGGWSILRKKLGLFKAIGVLKYFWSVWNNQWC